MTDKGYSLHEIAEALRITKRSAERRANKENWRYTEVITRGGKQRLYSINALPSEIQSALLKKAVAEVTNAFAEAPQDQQEQALEVLAAGKGSVAAVASPSPFPASGGGELGGSLALAVEECQVASALPAGKPSGGKAKLPALRQSAHNSLSQRQILAVMRVCWWSLGCIS